MGHLELTTSITPIEVKLQKNIRANTGNFQELCGENEQVRTSYIDTKTTDHSSFLNQFYLNNLTADQNEVVKSLLIQEQDVFSSGEDNLGCAKELQMTIELYDKTPVQKAYTAYPSLSILR